MEIANVLGQKGLLSQAIPTFLPREPQLKMAEAIQQAIKVNAQLVIEAGTGTGKTFGYLVPILISGKKTIISTGTKNLQDQLFFTDIPRIKSILNFSGKIALLKGRANYLCKYRLDKNLHDGRLTSRELVSQLHTVKEWSGITQSGDISDLALIPEDSAIWIYVTSTPDNCLGQDCTFYKECFVVKARQEALTAEVIVINHHLFFADLSLQEDGFGELLPGVDTIVFDEAHHLPDVASLFFSTTLTSRQLTEFARDTEKEIMTFAKDSSDIVHLTDRLQQVVYAMRLAFGSDLRRTAWPEILSAELCTAISQIKDILHRLETLLKTVAVRSKELENCWRRSLDLLERFNLLTEKNGEDKIHWFETYAQSFSLQLTPLIVAEQFKQHLAEKKRTWIFTSATLTVKNTFQLFIDSLGLQTALTIQLKSPFNYPEQALLYVPRNLPDPHASTYSAELIEAIIPVVTANEGRAFLLFTSYKAMEVAWQLLQEKNLAFPLLIQGSMPKKDLIAQFKKLGNAVLLGTSSFWYGVDVQGETLSCVIIDKLPFANLDDPILKARIKMLRSQGVDAFQYYQLPHAILTLKQGAGRLIRDYYDRGVLMIGDPRLVAARYGEAFLQSLPDMARTRDLEKVQQFLTR